MKQKTIKAGLSGLGVMMLVAGIIASGFVLTPNTASAFTWPWGDFHHKKAHAQEENGEENGEKFTVTIKKYIDGEMATSESADGNAFPMTSSWDDPDGIGNGSGSYELSSENSYTAQTSEMHSGADYSTSEVLDGDVVGTSCEEDHPYKLVGYSTGVSMEAAALAEVTGTIPSFVDLSGDQHVIVWNESCDDEEDDTPSSGNISGEVTGGQEEENPGNLEVTSVDAQKTTAIANGEFADGWQYVYNITVPTDEPNLAMKFADWMQTDGDHTIPVANNMRISSEQASATSTITLIAADTYSSPDLHMVGDLDEEEDGLQVQVLVEVAVPSDTFNGTYSTEYGVRTLP